MHTIRNIRANTVQAFDPASQTLSTSRSMWICALPIHKATTVYAPVNMPWVGEQFVRRCYADFSEAFDYFDHGISPRKIDRFHIEGILAETASSSDGLKGTALTKVCFQNEIRKRSIPGISGWTFNVPQIDNCY